MSHILEHIDFNKTKEILDQESNLVLGISLNMQNYFSDDVVMKYIEEFAPLEINFLIGDEIYAFTYSVQRQVSLRTAYRRAMAISHGQIGRMLERIIRREGLKCTILRWTDLRHHQEYRKIFQVVLKEYYRNEEFRDSIQIEMMNHVGNTIKLKRSSSSSGIEQYEIERLEKYLVYEIPGLIVLAEFTNYCTLIYPGNDLNIMKEIYGNKYPNIFKCLPNPYKRGFVSKRF